MTVTIHDVNGAPVEGATVVAVNQATNALLEAASVANGTATFAGASPGDTYEVYAVTAGGLSSQVHVVTVPEVAPSTVSLSTGSVDENYTGVVGTLSSDGDPAPTYAVTGGADAAKFSVSGTDLVLGTALDYESQVTAEVEVTATNGGGSHAQTITLAVGDVNDTVAPLAGIASWPEPTGANAYGDPHSGLDWVPQGTVATADNALNGRTAWVFTGSGRVEAPGALTGRPFTTLDSDFSVSVAVRRRVNDPASTANWHAIFGTGASTGTEVGYNAHFHGSADSLRLSFSDGVSVDSEYVSNVYDADEGGTSWSHATVVYDHALGNTRTFVDGHLVWGDGGGNHADEFAGMAGKTVTPANLFAWASRKGGSNSYAFYGDILPLGIYDRKLTDDEALALYNRGLGIDYAVAQTFSRYTSILWAMAGVPNGRTVHATTHAPSNAAVRLRAYVPGTLTVAAEGDDVAPDVDGIARPTVLCPADHTAYDVVVVADGYEQLSWAMRVVTAPAGPASYRAVQVGCQQTAYGHDVASNLLGMVRDPAGLDLITWNGDFHYEDPTNAAEALAALDLTLVGDELAEGQVTRHLTVNKAGVRHIVDNHEINVTADANPNKHTAGTAEMTALYRKALPNGAYADGTALYGSQVWGRTRWIWTDCRSERDPGAGQIVSPSQLSWIEGEITAARVAGEIPILVSGSPWEGAQADTWGTGAPSQRTAICDRIQAEHALSDGSFYCVLLLGDYHSLRADTFKTGATTALVSAGAVSVTVNVDPGVLIGSNGTTSKLTLDLGGAGEETVTVNARTDNGDGTWTLGLASGTANTHTPGVPVRSTRYGMHCTSGTAPISGFHSGRLSHDYGGLDDGLASDYRAVEGTSYLDLAVTDDGTTRTLTTRLMTQADTELFSWSRTG